MKGLMKVFCSDSVMWRGWRMISLLRESMKECAGICSFCRLQKRWIDTVEECLRKRGLNVRQESRVVQDRSEWWGFMKENAWG